MNFIRANKTLSAYIGVCVTKTVYDCIEDDNNRTTLTEKAFFHLIKNALVAPLTVAMLPITVPVFIYNEIKK